PPVTAQLLTFRRCALPRLSQYRTYSPPVAWWRRWRREWDVVRKHVSNQLLGAHVPLRRTLPQGGAVIAFVGADGSGKSTLVRELAAWLSPKVDVVHLYFGSGDGPASLPRQPLRG